MQGDNRAGEVQGGLTEERVLRPILNPDLSDETSFFAYITQLLYNDLSPMENHHSAAAFGIMRQPGNNFMDHLPRKVSRRRAGAGAGTTNGHPEGREGAWYL